MKTAMQELIEHIQVNATKFSLMNTFNILKEIEPYREKERKQIENAYMDGNHIKDEFYNPKEYYKQTYNN